MNQLQPLSEFTSRIVGNPKPAYSDIGYVAVRASVLYGQVAEFTTKRSLTDETQKIAAELSEKATVCQSLGLRFELVANNKAREVVMAQVEALAAAYSRLSEESFILNNNPFSPFIIKDLEAADAVYPIFRVINFELTMKQAGF